MLADLHIHTAASDGKLTPSQAVEWAKGNGVEIVAITDHDTVGGLDEGEQAAREQGLHFVRGIELSAQSFCDVHILGYGIDSHNEAFLSELDKIKRLRIERNIKIGRRLADCGVKLDFDFEAFGIGRMNMARAMVAQGFVKDVNEAFDVYLGTKGKAYCSSVRITPEQAVQLINDAGGFASIAHPKRYLLDKRLEKLLCALVPYGLKGLEVNYPTHFDSDKNALRQLCRKYGLLPTGGSDYHGDEDKSFVFHLDLRVIKELNLPI